MPQVSIPCPRNIQSMDYNLISLNDQVRIDTPRPNLIAELSTSLDNIQNIEQDYIDLFSYAKRGHMVKYVHKYRPDTYENVFKQDTYYPFKMERDLLSQKAVEICLHLQDVAEAIEIGPGSYTPIIYKSVPFLRALERVCSFSTYKAMDSTLEYAEQACKIINKIFKRIKTEPIEIDFLSIEDFEKIKYSLEGVRKKVIFGFGLPIFANNDKEDTSKFLKNIAMLLNKGDYLLFSIDENKDEDMLEGAYNTKLSYELLLNTMYYLKYKLNLKEFNPKAFDFSYKWDYKNSIVELFLKSTMEQNLIIRNQKFTINKNQEFNIINSLKLDIEQVRKILALEKLIIKEIITSSNKQKNKFSMLIVQKNMICF